MAVRRGSNRKGQGTLEYLLIIAVVIAAVALAAGTVIKPAVSKTLDDAKGAIENAGTQFSNKMK